MRAVLWVLTMGFFVAFFGYGYVLWKRAKQRRGAGRPDDVR